MERSKPTIPADASCEVHTSGYVATEPFSKDRLRKIESWLRKKFEPFLSLSADLSLSAERLLKEGRGLGFDAAEVSHVATKMGVKVRVSGGMVFWVLDPPPEAPVRTTRETRHANRTMYPSLSPAIGGHAMNCSKPCPDSRTGPIDPIAGIIEKAIHDDDVATLAAIAAYQWNQAAWYRGKYEALIAALNAGADAESLIAAMEAT